MNKINISYASNVEHNFAQRLIIKTIENLTGRRKLEKIYKNFSKNNLDPRFFWSGILDSMNIRVIEKSKYYSAIPSDGPLLMIANHPFGIVDGLIMCSLASKVRADFKIITHETLKLLPELDEFILPITFNEKDKTTIKENILTTKKAKNHLINGGLLIIFPSGGVSMNKNREAAFLQDKWKLFPAKLLQQTKSDVFPVYFDGTNGFLFNIFAEKIKNQTLKYSSYIHETKNKIGKEIVIYSGKVIKFEDLEDVYDRVALTEYLKRETYALGNR